jgi:hypothetical protein
MDLWIKPQTTKTTAEYPMSCIAEESRVITDDNAYQQAQLLGFRNVLFNRGIS